MCPILNGYMYLQNPLSLVLSGQKLPLLHTLSCWYTQKLDIIEIGIQRRNWLRRKKCWLKLLYRNLLNKMSCHHWMLSKILWSLMVVILEILLYRINNLTNVSFGCGTKLNSQSINNSDFLIFTFFGFYTNSTIKFIVLSSTSVQS